MEGDSRGSQSLIEEAVSVRPDISGQTDSFTNSHPLWLPPTSRGTYGGTFISQSISAAQATVPDDFVPYSIQSQFVRAGTPHDKLRYDVERISNGNSFIIRSVKAVQNDQVAFIAIVGLTRRQQQQQQPDDSIEVRPNSSFVAHSEPMPRHGPPPPTESIPDGIESATDPRPTHHRGAYLTKKVGMLKHSSGHPHQNRFHQWFKSRHALSPAGAAQGPRLQQAALAYICDNFLIQAVPHVNGVFDFVSPPQGEADVGGPDASTLDSTIYESIPMSDIEGAAKEGRRRVGMIVSLSHTMYFHAPADVNVEEWMLSETGSYWSGDGRGVATQRIWNRAGVLLASSYQEGVVRLVDDAAASRIERSRL